MSGGSRGLLAGGASPPAALLGLGAAEPSTSEHLPQEAATARAGRDRQRQTEKPYAFAQAYKLHHKQFL